MPVQCIVNGLIGFPQNYQILYRRISYEKLLRLQFLTLKERKIKKNHSNLFYRNSYLKENLALSVALLAMWSKLLKIQLKELTFN